MDTPQLRKARGAFFTPPEISRYVAEWSVRKAADRVLEPSCGEAGFLVEAGRKLESLGVPPLLLGDQLCGVEIHEASAGEAAAVLKAAGLHANIHIGDFFEHRPAELFDALIGNPPYVRYQQHVGDARAKSLEAALAQGVRLSGLASSWAAFVVHAASFLKPDGRLGLVLPAELLTVKYAAEVRRYAVLVGLFFLDQGAEQDGTTKRRSTFTNAHARMRLFTGRDDPAGRDEQYERLYLALLDAAHATTRVRVFEAGKPNKPVPMEQLLDELVELVAERNPDFYEAVEGGLVSVNS
jgi:tRNA G10  N-methylase Trm11